LVINIQSIHDARSEKYQDTHCMHNVTLIRVRATVAAVGKQWVLYRVIHKSVKHFKNSQQIKYSTDHGISYADRERNSPNFFIHISQMLNVSTFGNTADIYAIVHLFPHACQHTTVDQSHSSGDTVAKILEISGEWRHKDSVLHKPP